MRAAELMIGDWVCVDGVEVSHDGNRHILIPLHRRVAGIEEGTIKLEDGYVIMSCMCMPLLLTDVILRNNGFEMHKIFSDYRISPDWVWTDGKLRSIVREEDDEVYIECIYVHQFQHALKLFGIKKEIEIC